MTIVGEQAKHSILGNVARVIYEVLENSSCRAEEVFAAAGVRTETLNNPEHRLTFQEQERLLTAAQKATKDDVLGLHFGERIHPTTFHALGLALLSSSTIRAFCDRLARYYTFITSNETIVLYEDAESLQIQLIPKPEVSASPIYPLLAQGSFATQIAWLRSMYQWDYAPAKVCFSFAKPKNTKAYTDYFHAPCEFDCSVDAMYLVKTDLEVPLPAANAELARMHDEVVVKFLAKMNDKDLVRRVHAQIIQLLPSGNCSKPTIAHAMNMSVRTLHNRLTQEGTSYQDILVDTRRELAEQYIEQRNLSVSEIAYTLGFSDCSNFSRAFQRWMGCSPSKYRETLESR
ncbi:MAG: AraC family transcriptional regulator [Pseudomonadales bacterium]|nr:AraC family transcriptional regulator [Pseudomonadales bacterium]